MKKILKALCLATILLLPLVGCNNDPDTGEITIQKQIDAGGTVDLKDELISEDVTINKAVILKNANFKGHTITVNADTTLNNITNANVVIAGTNTEREAIITEKAITLTISGSSTIISITVKRENASIKSLGTSVKIQSLEIGSAAKNVDISGGQITTLSVVFTDNETSKNVLNISGGVEIANTEAITESGSPVSDKSIYVTITDEKTKEPNGVQNLDVISVELIKGTNVKTEYEVGDSFDFTGLSVEVTYSDGSKKTLPLSSKITKVEGLPSSTTGEKDITLTVTYNGIETKKTFTVTIIESAKDYVNLLNKAVDCFADMDFDNGLAKIKAAYEDTKNDTTKMYYALATLALVSTDNATVDFMKNTCGFKSYPNTLNAIITESWWEDCIEEGFVERIVKANPEGFNDALNKLVSIFETAYNKAVDISKEMEQESVLLPARLIEVLNLNEILGSAADIRLGKAQLDMILAYVGIIKGALQYVSAFDWTFNTSSIKTGMDIDDFIMAVKTGTKLFTVTNASVLDKSKDSFVTSVELIMSSYDYILTSASSIYPDEVKEVMQAYRILYDAATELKKAITEGKTFYVPDTNILELTTWPTTESDSWLVKIDCGEMFSEHVLDNAIEKDSSGRVQFYTYYEWYYGYRITESDTWKQYSNPEKEDQLFDGTVTFDDIYMNIKNEVTTKIPENAVSSEWDFWVMLGIKVQLPKCITIKGIEGDDRKITCPIWGTSEGASYN